MQIYSSIVENIAHHAANTPDALSLADGKQAFTYRKLWNHIYGLAQKLKELGVTKESCVVVECDQSARYMICEFAIQLLGGVFVPLEKNAASSRAAEIAIDTEAVLYIGKELPEEALKETARAISFLPLSSIDTHSWEEAPVPMSSAHGCTANQPGDSEKQPMLSAHGCPAECLAAFPQSHSISNLTDHATEPLTNHPVKNSSPVLCEIDFPASDQIAEILFSTGTTGKSKGIVLTHGNDIALAENVMYGVQMKKGNVELIPMPLSHSHGLRRTYANLVMGNSAVFTDGVTLLKKVFNLMEQYHVTSMDLSPSMLSIIFKLSKDRLGDYADQIDYIQLGSAPLPEKDKIHLSRILPKTRLYNFYGSTEAGCSCLLDFNSMSGKPGCIGKPAVNARFIVVDEHRNEIKSSPDNPGFLASAGSINMKEYFKAPELTAAAMENGFIYTKDLGYIDEEGYVYMLGRKDDVINYGGIKISPEEIESVVIQNPAIRDCACIPVKDALTGQAPKLLIVLEGREKQEGKFMKGQDERTATAQSDEGESNRQTAKFSGKQGEECRTELNDRLAAESIGKQATKIHDGREKSDNHTEIEQNKNAAPANPASTPAIYDEKAFKAFLAANLDASKQPKYIEIVDEIPRTFNGKIKRNVLLEREKKS